jgi:hypothetical protein
MILFLPLTPIAALAVIFYGLGLLPLSPLLAFIASIGARSHLTKRAGRRLKGLWLGFAAAFAVLVVAELPSTTTRLLLDMAASEKPDTSSAGIKWLRWVGSDEVLLRSCYERPGMATDFVGFMLSAGGAQVRPRKAREIYYRVTGTPFNAVPPPPISARGRFRVREDFEFDADQGGTTVAGRIKGLSLAGSSMDGSVDADAALAYVEWTLVFRNDSRVQREARAQVALPPGGVVSRLTLWVNGKEREAAYAGKGRVREAYERVVRRRRDPALVTTSGPDRVLLQCFPVPPGGTMKVKIGVTSPLVLQQADEGVLVLPCFAERNFSIPEGTKHSVWIEGRQVFLVAPAGLATEKSRDGTFALRGELGEDQLGHSAAAIPIMRRGATNVVWTRDTLGDGEAIVLQQIEKDSARLPSRVVVLIDGSRGMRKYADDLADAIAAFPTGAELAVILASDDVVEAVPVGEVSEGVLAEAANSVRDFGFTGGCDNVPALMRAWDIAADKPGSVILWVHAGQPMILADPEPLLQRWRRRPEGPELLMVPVAPGPNKVLEALDGVDAVDALPRVSSLGEDFKRLCEEWSGAKRRIRLVRKRHGPDYEVPDEAKATSLHIARLWARDEVEALRSDATTSVEPAIALAITYRLVTPVSGAVVLESKEQYAEAGLSPVAPGTVPTIPEPEMVALMVVVALAFVAFVWRRRKQCIRPAC